MRVVGIVAVVLFACACRTYDTIYTDDAGGQCVTPNTICSGQCVDPGTDRNHCGTCDHVCTANQLCSLGACVACPKPGQVVCGTTGAAFCADLSADNQNCGSCGRACGHGTLCQNGQCICPLTDCSGECVDVNTDVSHCGSCTTPCPGTAANEIALCTSGQCSIACIAPFADCDGQGSNGCEANLQTSMTNCGQCGRSCIGSTACSKGMCAITTYATGTQLGALALDGTNVYWADRSTNGAIFDEPIGGGTSQSVYPDNLVTVLAVDSSRLVWLHVNNQIESRLLGGGSAIVLDSVSGVLAMTAGGGYVYYAVSAGGVYRVPIDGSSGPVMITTTLNAQSIAVDATNVYFAAGTGDVLYAPIGAQNVAASIFAQNASAAIVTLDGSNVYWATTVGDLYAQPKASTQAKKLAGAQSVATNLATDGIFLYWGTSSGDIERVSVNGGTPVAIALAQPGGVRAVAVDGSRVYWSSSAVVASTTK